MANNLQAKFISKYALALNEGGTSEQIEAYEDVICDSMDEVVDEEAFYDLPTSAIKNILRKSSTTDMSVIDKAVKKTQKKKGKYSISLDEVIKKEEPKLETPPTEEKEPEVVEHEAEPVIETIEREEVESEPIRKVESSTKLEINQKNKRLILAFIFLILSSWICVKVSRF